jgi:CheY-like chemotaxis protein
MGNRKRILIVDDDPQIRSVYREMLESAGYDITATDQGSEGLETVEQGEIDLVLLDIRMPGMDGLEFLARVREINESLPIILSSAYAAYKEDFRSWGADAFVMKGTDPKSLKEAVGRFIGEGKHATE